MRKLLSLIYLIIIIAGFIACTKPPVVDVVLNTDENNWDLNKKLKTEINIGDTLTPYDFYIYVRNTTDYKYSNFFLFIKTTFPNGQVAIDTLECLLADKEGKWFGKGRGKIRDNKILLKKNAIFQMKGLYKFEIEHAMRSKSISGIKSIGFKIEKVNQK